MRTVSLTLDYLQIEDLLTLLEWPYQTACQRILSDHRPLFEKARGSTHNHQTWEGGYIDHVTDGMNYARHLYVFDKAFGRRLPFSLSDALLIFFLHDLEKPWRIIIRENGEVTNKEGLDTKKAFQWFREEKLREYGLDLNPYLMNALTYVEGELANYSSTHRVMNELAAFCHKVDVWCARGWYDYPRVPGDALDQPEEWIGAGRFRTT